MLEGFHPVYLCQYLQSALQLSSPKFAPVSSVNTISLNDGKSVNTTYEPTNFSLLHHMLKMTVII